MALATALKQNHTLTSLALKVSLERCLSKGHHLVDECLQESGIGDSGALALAMLLQVNCSLVKLDLGVCTCYPTQVLRGRERKL